MPRLSGILTRLAAVAAGTVLAVAGAAGPAHAAPSVSLDQAMRTLQAAAVVTSGTIPVGGSSHTVVPYDGGLAASIDISVSATTSAASTTPGKTIDGVVPVPICRTAAIRYQIYIPVVNVVLMHWLINYKWCILNVNHLISSVSSSDQVTIDSPVMRWSRTATRTIGSTNGGRATTVRVLYDGAEYQYCPVTGAGTVSCIAAYHPRIDVYLNNDFSVLDVSVT
jgi:hypothetical protein